MRGWAFLLSVQTDKSGAHRVINVLKMLIFRQVEYPFVYLPDFVSKVVIEDSECVLSYIKDYSAYLLV
jgi:hypothetical protein